MITGCFIFILFINIIACARENVFVEYIVPRIIILIYYVVHVHLLLQALYRLAECMLQENRELKVANN